MIDSEPKEQLGDTTDVVSKDIVSPLQPIPVLPIEHPEPEEENFYVPQMIDNNSKIFLDADIQNRFELPPKSTRGIPPKRYIPEFEAQRSRYPTSKESNENLSHSAMAFNTALYSNNVPKNVEEAL